MVDQQNPSDTPQFNPEMMEHKFLSGDTRGSRRKFLKKSGGATLGAFVAWGLNSKNLRAEDHDVSDSEDTIELVAFPSNANRIWSTTFKNDTLLLTIKCVSTLTPSKTEGDRADQWSGKFAFDAIIHSNRILAPQGNTSDRDTVNIAGVKYKYQTPHAALSCTSFVEYQIDKAADKPDGTKQILLSYPDTDLQGSGQGMINGKDYKLALALSPTPAAGGIHAVAVTPSVAFKAAVAWPKAAQGGITFKITWPGAGHPGLGIDIVDPAGEPTESVNDTGSQSTSFKRVD